MKKQTAAVLAVTVAAIVINCGCQKNYNSAGPDPSGLNVLFYDLKTDGQSFTVQAGQDTTVSGSSGTGIHFYPNSFKDANGKIITSGTVSLNLTEMYQTGDMIANHATTMCGSKVLQSGGQVNLIATMGGRAVYANKFGLSFKQATPSSMPMNLFFGNQTNVTQTTTWTNAIDTAGRGTWASGTSTGASYFFDSCTSFGYINCDRFCEDTNLTSVGATMPDNSFSASNTQLYLVLPTINSVLSNVGGVEPSLGYDSINKKMSIISEDRTNIVPIGMTCKLVVIAKKGNDYYYFENDGTTAANMVVTANMVKKSSAEVKALLKAL